MLFMHFITQPHAIRIIGLELRTSNEVAMQTIPSNWQRFMAEAVMTQIEGKLSNAVYAVYTHFENAGHNNIGQYSMIIGAQVSSQHPVPVGLCHCTVPAGPRAVFKGVRSQPERISEIWQEVWLRTDLPKTFVAEYERYLVDGTIEVSIGLR